MKKLLFTLFAALLTLNVAAQENNKCGDNLYWEYDENEKTLTITGRGAMYNYDFNNSKLAPWQFKTISEVIMDDGIEHIGNYAFVYHTNLKTINIPNSLQTIGDYAFLNCISLDINSNIEREIAIGQGAFSGCSKMETDNAIYFGTTLVKGLDASKISVKENTTIINSGAFKNNEKLTEIIIPDGVNTIGDEAFSGCTSLVICDIPSTVKNWGKRIFENCTAMQTSQDGIYQMAGDHVIVKVADNGKSQKKYTINENIKYIEQDAFKDCTNLKYLVYKPSEVPAKGGNIFGDNNISNAILTTAVPNGKEADYSNSSMGNNINTSKVTLRTDRYTSFTFLHDATIPNSVGVYIAECNNASEVQLTKVNHEQPDFKVKAGEGFLLKTDEFNTNATKEYVFGSTNGVDGESFAEKNHLIGITDDKTFTGEEQAYVLQTRENVQKFYHAGNGLTLAMCKAYLDGTNIPNGIKTLSFFADVETAISNIEEEENIDNKAIIYNMVGQKMTRTQKGLNVINGKIVIK